MHSNLGSRMKEYEENNPATNNGVNIIRLDGKAFHTWTRKVTGNKNPFSSVIHECMVSATIELAKEVQGFKLAYTQSDETTLLMENLSEKTEAWFGGKPQKIISVASSIFTYAFNNRFRYYIDTFGYPNVPAYFDARVHSIPVDDAANNFVWRQKDWHRNSIQMLGQYYLTHAEMQRLSNDQVIEFLRESRDIDWHELEDWKRYGTFVAKNHQDPESYGPYVSFSDYLDYRDASIHAGISQYIDWSE